VPAGAVVDPHSRQHGAPVAGRDQQAQVGFEELDVADPAEADVGAVAVRRFASLTDFRALYARGRRRRFRLFKPPFQRGRTGRRNQRPACEQESGEHE